MESTTRPFPGVFELIRGSIEFYKKNYKSLILIGLAPSLISTASQFLNEGVSSPVSIAPQYIIVGVVMGIVFVILNVFMQIMHSIVLAKGTKELRENKVVDVNSLYSDNFSLFFPFLFISILTTLVMIGAGIFFIIPGIIACVYTMFAGFSFVFDNKKGLESLSESYHLVKGNWWKVFGRVVGVGIIITLIYLLASAVIGFILFAIISAFGEGYLLMNFGELMSGFVGSLSHYISIVVFTILGGCVFMPLSVYAFYEIYKHLKSIKSAQASEKEAKESRAWFLGLSIWGLFVAVIITILVAAAVFVSTLWGDKIKIEIKKAIESGLEEGKVEASVINSVELNEEITYEEEESYHDIYYGMEPEIETEEWLE